VVHALAYVLVALIAVVAAAQIELAAGLARQTQNSGRDRLSDIRVLAIVVLGTALLIALLIAGAVPLICFGAVFLLTGLFAVRSTLQTHRHLREAIARDRGIRTS
jgi:uncharacterized membrane protein HdeD (DUF308 family)